MHWIVTPYALALWISTMVAFPVSLLIWRKRRMPGGAALAYLLFSLCVWTFFAGLEAAVVETDHKILFSVLSYFGVVTAPPCLMLFALGYTGLGSWWLGRRQQIVLFIIPLVTLLLAVTNGWHGLLWSSFTRGADPADNLLVYGHGIGFYFAIAYVYLCIIVAMGALATHAVRTRDIYRVQSSVVLGILPLPWVANILYVAGIGPSQGQDLSPVAMAGSSLVLAFIYLRLQFLELVPIARHALVEQMPDGVLVLDERNRILDHNPAGRAYFSPQATAALGSHVRQALKDWPALTAACVEPGNGSRQVCLTESPPRFLDVRRISLLDHGGAVRARLVVMRDVTAHRLAEGELHDANLSLAQRLQELEARNQELDAFAHTVAHDLRTPLGLVAGYCELLGRDSPQPLSEEETEQALQAMNWATHKMDSIIDALLLLARVRETEVVTKPLNMEALIRDVINRLKREIDEKHATVEFEGVEDWPTALGHAPWLEEVWANYMLNAIKYGGSPPAIELGATRINEGYVRFWVRDNGLGIPEEVQPLLFAPFERIGRSHAAGYGLGLSIVRRIIEKLGGSVAVKSSAGGGSTFSFTLPACPEGNDDQTNSVGVAGNP